MIDELDDLNDLGLVDDHRFSDVNFFNDGVFDSFNNGFLDNFPHNFHHLMNHWDFDDFFHFHWNLLYHLHDLLDNHFHWLDDFLSHQFFSDHLHFLDLHSLVHHLNYFLYDCRHFDNLLHSLDHGHDFLHNAIDWLVDCFDVVVDFKRFAVFD
jgi:hypothetical protein